MPTYGYAVEQISGAVHTLATEEGTLKERLEKASVEIAFAFPKDLPPDVADDLRKLQTELKNLQGKTASSQELSRYADRLVAFSHQLILLQHKYDSEYDADGGYIALS